MTDFIKRAMMMNEHLTLSNIRESTHLWFDVASASWCVTVRPLSKFKKFIKESGKADQYTFPSNKLMEAVELFLNPTVQKRNIYYKYQK